MIFWTTVSFAVSIILASLLVGNTKYKSITQTYFNVTYVCKNAFGLIYRGGYEIKFYKSDKAMKREKNTYTLK